MPGHDVHDCSAVGAARSLSPAKATDLPESPRARGWPLRRHRLPGLPYMSWMKESARSISRIVSFKNVCTAECHSERKRSSCDSLGIADDIGRDICLLASEQVPVRPQPVMI